MPKPATCPLCHGEVHEGVLFNPPQHLSAGWVDGEPEEGFLGNLKLRGKARRKVRGLRCAKCGYLLLFAH